MLINIFCYDRTIFGICAQQFFIFRLAFYAIKWVSVPVWNPPQRLLLERLCRLYAMNAVGAPNSIHVNPQKFNFFNQNKFTLTVVFAWISYHFLLFRTNHQSNFPSAIMNNAHNYQQEHPSMQMDLLNLFTLLFYLIFLKISGVFQIFSWEKFLLM